MSLSDATLRVSTLDTFRLAVAEIPEAVAPHVRYILSGILDLLDSNNRQNPIDVRVAALKCLGQFPGSLSYDVLRPHLSYVTKQLVKPLDDRKRLVRREAVECRAKWYAIAA